MSNTLQLEACVCASTVVALSDEGFADYQADLAALDRDCTPFEDAIECITPAPGGPPVCTDGQCQTTDEGGCNDECRGVDGES